MNTEMYSQVRHPRCVDRITSFNVYVEMYIGILRRLRYAVRRKSPKNGKKQQLVSPSRQCFSTRVGFSQGFLIKE